jgi:hypothetical protein
MKGKALAASLLLILCVAAAAQQPAEVTKYELRYTPNAELVTLQQVSARVDEVLMENNPLGIEGWMKGKLQHRAGTFNEETQTFPMTLELDGIAQEFNGQPVSGPEQSRISVELTPLGQLKNPQQPAVENGPMAMFVAGVPIQMLALLCHVVVFPDHPVAVGERWVTEGQADISPDMQLPLEVGTELLNVSDEHQATLLSDMDLRLADFKAPNPLGYGDPVTVRNGRLTISDLTRVFDLQNGVVLEAEGSVGFTGQIDLAGFPLTARADLSFSLSPQPQKEKPGQPQQQPAVGAVEGGQAAGN